VRSARRQARRVLCQWHLEAFADTVELLVSELTTNAVRASAMIAEPLREVGQVRRAARVRFWLTSDRHSVLIQVWDGGHHQPARQNARLDAEAGRGLLLVETLSAQWGCYAPARPAGLDGPAGLGGLDGPAGLGGKIVWALCAR
jgi:anti-sigma regulatory factor (Ser/Thr protein kinase)